MRYRKDAEKTVVLKKTENVHIFCTVVIIQFLMITERQNFNEFETKYRSDIFLDIQFSDTESSYLVTSKQSCQMNLRGALRTTDLICFC